jgi:hypothetical protein
MTGAISVPVTAASRGGRRDQSAQEGGRSHQPGRPCSSGALKRVMYHHPGCPRGESPGTYMPAITGELVLGGQR